jgi:hypothetical protein
MYSFLFYSCVPRQVISLHHNSGQLVYCTMPIAHRCLLWLLFLTVFIVPNSAKIVQVSLEGGNIYDADIVVENYV